ncbi:hypothetical protein FB567DRAFT_553697 [Paraphoma chrysanthemicola]|uniref:Uncharacterized protein n=1 Tax=Paraphoma chrysanthemicola TaxID=798071 RepID=A0A8K0VU82_9PLEO|nr:hypothetical protein FB567DRAFT_553697 [Paraphoma chrysanthemicola]
MPRRGEKPDRLEERLYDAKHGRGSLARRLTLLLQPVDESNPRSRYDNRYEFQSAPYQQDPVAKCIRAGIRKLNGDPERYVIMSNVNIRIAAFTSKAPIWPPNAEDSNRIKLYTFFQDEHEFLATVTICVQPRQGPLTLDKIHVREARRWTPIEQWLVKLADPAILKKRSTSSITYFVNRRSGRVFRLMDLPVELRLAIFELVISPSGEVYPINMVFRRPWSPGTIISKQEREKNTLSLGFGYNSKDTDRFKAGFIVPNSRSQPQEVSAGSQAPSLALLCVSKQIKQECLRAGWEGLKRCFVNCEIFAAVADSKLEPIKITRQLSSRFDRDLPLGAAFPRPDPEDGYLGHPWGTIHEETSCQTVLTDWIMTFAFDHIKHIRDVDLVGFVKKPQKEMWLRRLARQRAEEDYDFDYAAAINAILTAPSVQLPPTCVCRKRCINLDRDRNNTSPDGYGRYNSRWSRDYFSKHTRFDFEDGRDNDARILKPHVSDREIQPGQGFAELTVDQTPSRLKKTQDLGSKTAGGT